MRKLFVAMFFAISLMLMACAEDEAESSEEEVNNEEEQEESGDESEEEGVLDIPDELIEDADADPIELKN